MSRVGENIYKRKDGRWEARYIKNYEENGKAKYGYLYAKSYKEVKAKLFQVNNLKNIHYPANILFQDIAEQWLQNKKMKLKESSYAKYDYLINKYLKNNFGSYPIGKLSRILINQVLTNLLKKLSPKTVIDITAILKSIFKYAVNEGYQLNYNLDNLKIMNRPRQVITLDPKEKKLLSDYLFNHLNNSNLGILLSLYTGIRIGELCALKWKDVSLEDNIIKIRNTLLRTKNYDFNSSKKTRIIITAPKSYSSIRDIPIPDFLIPLILKFKCCSDDYYVLTNRSSYLDPRTLQNRFKRCLKEAGIKEKNFHVLRHTFATSCVELGFEIKSLSEILGHCNVNTTLNKYVHSSLELKKNNMQKLTAF